MKLSNRANSPPMPIFDRADANRDGVIDKAELAAIRTAMQGID